MLVHARRAYELFPRLAHELTRKPPVKSIDRIIGFGGQICSVVNEYETAIAAAAAGAVPTDLIASMEDFAIMMPCFVEQITSSAISDEPLTASIAFECLVCGLRMLVLEKRDWPPSRKVGPRLLTGLLTFFRASLTDQQPLIPLHARYLITLLGDIVSWLKGLDRYMLNIPATMFADIYVLACQVVCNQPQTTLQPVETPTGLLLLVVCRSNLMPQSPEAEAHVTDMMRASRTVAWTLARMAVVVLARTPTSSSCTSGSYPPCHSVAAFFRVLFDMEIDGTCDATFVRALYKCSARHPCSAAFCNSVVLRRISRTMHMRLMSSDDVSIWGCVMTRCLQRTHDWMRRGLPMSQLFPESYAMSMAMYAAMSADPANAPMDCDMPGFKKFSCGLAMKGSVQALEALFRGTGVRRLPDPTFLVAQFSALRLILMTSADGVHLPFEEILGLVVTAHKLTGMFIRSVGDDWGDLAYPADTLAHSIISVLEAVILTSADGEFAVTSADGEFADTPLDSDRMQTYLIVAVTLQPVLRRLRVTAHSGWGAVHLRAKRLLPMPDCDRKPERWTALAEDFERRLLPGCGNLDCDNIAAVLDCMVKTKLCSTCRRVRYCSQKCQKADWRKGGHGRVCGRGWWCGEQVPTS